MREDEFQHYNMVIASFDFQEFSCDFEGITLIVAFNIVKTSTYITSLLSGYYPINVNYPTITMLWPSCNVMCYLCTLCILYILSIYSVYCLYTVCILSVYSVYSVCPWCGVLVHPHHTPNTSLLFINSLPCPPPPWCLIGCWGPAVVRRHIYTGRFLTNRQQRGRWWTQRRLESSEGFWQQEHWVWLCTQTSRVPTMHWSWGGRDVLPL